MQQQIEHETILKIIVMSCDKRKLIIYSKGADG